MELIWKNALPTDLSANLAEWLLHAGSFMERLRSKNIHDAMIHVLGECWGQPSALEVGCLQKVQSDALIREVLINSQQKQWMYARTVIPRETIAGELSVLGDLKNRSLGSVLFQQPDMQRSAFDFVMLQPDTEWHQKMTAYLQCELPALWMRRSVFSIAEKKILLTEVFLPDIIAL